MTGVQTCALPIFNGRVILYGDVITKSMNEAINETKRRREIQKEYNIFHHIDPKSVVREVSEDILNLDYGIDEKTFKKVTTQKKYSSREDIEKQIKNLEKEIKNLAADLDFETAIKKRDEMLELKNILLEF